MFLGVVRTTTAVCCQVPGILHFRGPLLENLARVRSDVAHRTAVCRYYSMKRQAVSLKYILVCVLFTL